MTDLDRLEELERAYGALRWIYTNGVQKLRPKAVSDVINEAFASYRIAQADMPAPRPEGTDIAPERSEPLITELRQLREIVREAGSITQQIFNEWDEDHDVCKQTVDAARALHNKIKEVMG